MVGGVPRLVKDAMSRNVVAVSPDASVYRAAVLMAERGVGSCVVLRDEKLAGIVTERDLVRRVIAKGLSPKRTRIGDVMSAPVTVVGENATLEEAVDVMADQGVKRLVVVGEGGVVGVVSVSDIVRAMARAEAEMRGIPRIFLRKESET